jgi:hypothetical protein
MSEQATTSTVYGGPPLPDNERPAQPWPQLVPRNPYDPGVNPTELLPPPLKLCPLCNRHISDNNAQKCPFCSAKRADGIKHDAGKRRYSLLPRKAFGIVVDAFTKGAESRGDWNWVSVPNARERYYNAALRHIDAWWCGESKDPDSGLHPLAHAAASIFILLALDIGDTGPTKKER